jgi:parallel beta-helix repeat protein
MKQRATVITFILLVAMGVAGRCVQAANLNVNCDKRESIREALKFLAAVSPQGPNTVSVVGSCKENILIQGMDRLALLTKRGASITDRSSGSSPVIDIEDSHSVTLKGFTINGTVSCGASSICYLTSNTIQDSAGDGIDVTDGSHASLESNVIQNNGGRGSTVSQGSQILSSNDIFQDNAAQGIVVLGGSYFQETNGTKQVHGKGERPN